MQITGLLLATHEFCDYRRSFRVTDPRERVIFEIENERASDRVSIEIALPIFIQESLAILQLLLSPESFYSPREGRQFLDFENNQPTNGAVGKSFLRKPFRHDFPSEK